MADETRARHLPTLPLPSAFVERMAAALGDEFDAFLASYQAAPVQGLRVNTLKIAAADLVRQLPFDMQPVPWSQDTFVVADDPARPDRRPGKHVYHAAGLYYLQDPSATAPVEILDPQPGETVLDVAAAPGGKSTHIASRLQGQGLLVANEVIPKRAWELAGNLERWGATNAAITTESPERLAERWRDHHDAGGFDAVLVDAPCSGEGMFRKSDAARREWTPGLVEGCAMRQDAILEQVATLVKPGGRLVYSTCTFAPIENEGTVARFLDHHPEFSLAQPAVLRNGARPDFEPGRPEWLPDELRRTELTRCVRLWPHHVPGEGHFAALLVKSGDAPPRSLQARHPLPRLPKNVELAYTTFVADTFLQPPTQAPLIMDGAYLYALPTGIRDLAGLGYAGRRYLHPGWWLGELKKDRFEPSHALALSLNSTVARRVKDFTVDDPGLLSYLRGETINSAGHDGWTIVAVNNFSVGWAKRVAGRLKSHYPKGLRTVGR
jgi:16S rRNA C967 or C1407 C5-methylase (RsmB/RsmF family)/NOL1/NOP2/fmu family ribosome biogenesis protein